MRRDGDLSKFIVVREDIVKAFDHVTRGPQDATCVDGVKEIHGDSSARYLLHFHTHGPVYTQVRHIPVRFDFHLLLVLKSFVGDMTYQEAQGPRCSPLWTDWRPLEGFGKNTVQTNIKMTSRPSIGIG